MTQRQPKIPHKISPYVPTALSFSTLIPPFASLLLWSKFSKTFVDIQQQRTFSNMRLIFMQSVLFQLTF